MEPELLNAALSLDENVGLTFIGENVIEETKEKAPDEKEWEDQYYGCYCS